MQSSGSTENAEHYLEFWLQGVHTSTEIFSLFHLDAEELCCLAHHRRQSSWEYLLTVLWESEGELLLINAAFFDGHKVCTALEKCDLKPQIFFLLSLSHELHIGLEQWMTVHVLISSLQTDWNESRISVWRVGYLLSCICCLCFCKWGQHGTLSSNSCSWSLSL